MTLALAFVAATASATVLKTGTLPSNVCPPFPGVTPATTCVPYSIICFVWNEPSRGTRLRVERAVASGDALHHQLRVLVDEDAHAAIPPPVTSATACRTHEGAV